MLIKSKLDIEMPLLDGMGAAMEIRDKGDDVIIIFVTNAPEYAEERLILF